MGMLWIIFLVLDAEKLKRYGLDACVLGVCWQSTLVILITQILFHSLLTLNSIFPDKGHCV